MQKINYPLEVKDLQKKYIIPSGEFFAVNNISFQLNQGEILGFLGPNGSGKTTTIQMLLGTLIPTTGHISFFGMDIRKRQSEIFQHVTFASTYTFPMSHLTIEQNLNVAGLLYGYEPYESKKMYIPLLEKFGLTQKLYQRVSVLSAGQRTGLMLVKAFFTNPKVLILDEPTASLDPDVANEVCAFILEMRNIFKTSILFTSHKMEEVMKICDRAIFLKKGHIIADGAPKDLVNRNLNHQVKLIVVEGLKKLIDYFNKNHFNYINNNLDIVISLNESEIPKFLKEIDLLGVIYSSILIEEPTLEDYFIEITRGKA